MSFPGMMYSYGGKSALNVFLSFSGTKWKRSPRLFLFCGHPVNKVVMHLQVIAFAV